MRVSASAKHQPPAVDGSGKKKRQTPFQPAHTVQYGLSVVERDSETGEVLSVVCRFCETFAREQRPGRKRKATRNAHYFTRPFRPENYRKHNDTQHTQRWREYCDLTETDKLRYFEDNDDQDERMNGKQHHVERVARMNKNGAKKTKTLLMPNIIKSDGIVPAGLRFEKATEYEKRILVTGGAGFIGSHVVIHLVKQYPQYYIVNLDSLDYCSCARNVHSAISSSYGMTADENEEEDEEEEEEEERDIDDDEVDRSLRRSFCEWDEENRGEAQLPRNYKFIKGSIECADLVEYILQTERIDTIMHFAAQSHVDNSFGNSIAFSKTNILGTHVLLEAARIHGGIKKFIHVSTDEVYGEGNANTVAMREDHTLEPTNPYAATKAGAEFLVKAYQRSFQLPTVITRSNNVYGPHQYPEKLIPKFINQIATGRPMTIHGDGSNTRNYLYISDAVAAFDLVLHEGVIGEVYNIGGANEISNKQVALALLAIMRPHLHSEEQINPLITYVKDRPFNDFRYTIDSSKLRALGWKEHVMWREGLRRTVQWNCRFAHRFTNLKHALEPHPIAFRKSYSL